MDTDQAKPSGRNRRVTSYHTIKKLQFVVQSSLLNCQSLHFQQYSNVRIPVSLATAGHLMELNYEN